MDASGERPVWMQGWPAPSPQSPLRRAGNNLEVQAGVEDQRFLLGAGDDDLVRPAMQSQPSSHLRAQHVQDQWGSTDPRSSRPAQRPEDSVMMETSPDVSPRLPPGLSPDPNTRGSGQLDSFSRLVSFGHAEPASVETHGTSDGGRAEKKTNFVFCQSREPTPTVRTGSWASDQIPYSDDPYLARMRANVAALGEVTAKLRESVSLDKSFDTHSRSVMLESEIGYNGAVARINSAQSHATSDRSVVPGVQVFAFP